jgi:hypothetical protein
VIEVLDFNLRGGKDAPAAAARVARVTERYLSPAAARDTMAVTNEIVSWLAAGALLHSTLRLELSVTSAVVRVSVTAGKRSVDTTLPNGSLRGALPVTAALASRFGFESRQRTRIWAEFDRIEKPVAAYTESEYS